MTEIRAPATGGGPEPFGATLDEGGARFAVQSHHASRIWVCLFDDQGHRELARIPLGDRTGDIHHGRVPGLGEGTRYGLRAEGPFDPARGLHFNPAKLLLDPYAFEFDRPVTLSRLMTAHVGDGRTPCPEDSAPLMPKCVLRAAPAAPRTRPPRITPGRRIVYEILVRAFTMRHPAVAPEQRGTVGALAHPAVIEHLQKLGVTSLELMPLTARVDERHLVPLGLTNAWGYSPVSFLAPEPRLAPGGIAEVRDTVDALHDAGFEVILDVVFNHTGESDIHGPSLSLRGLDSPTYYRHDADGRLINDTGCGNTLACDRPAVIRLVLDALRHWVVRTGIDGFRFDLATTLGRRADGFHPDHPLLAAIAQDPVLRDRVLIVEPWDIGPGGHRLGAFGYPFLEWNDRYRDDVRRFWRGDHHMVGALATRLAGSSDVFRQTDRLPTASINFVACHDGFALADLVAYEHKHNEANGEGNRDGADANYSWNHGVEGTTINPAVNAARRCDVRAMLATLLVSRGTPMITAGDEFGRTQGGNNNAYAQDNPTTWLDWEAADQGLLAFTREAIAARRALPALREDRFLSGLPVDGSGIQDAVWLAPSGLAMTTADWDSPHARLLGLALAMRGEDGGPPDRTLIYINGGWEDTPVVLPDPEHQRVWREMFDSATGEGGGTRTVDGLAEIVLPARSVRLFSAVPAEAPTLKAPRKTGVDPNVLVALAEAAGIERDWWSLDGATHKVSPDTMRHILAGMGLPAATTAQARDSIAHLTERAATRKAITAPPCYTPPCIAGEGKVFGLAAHLYALRHRTDMGIGDFETLGRFGEMAGRLGAALVGVNPFHALFPTDRERASPYYPADRRFLDPLYIDCAALPNLDDAPRAKSTLEQLASAAARVRSFGQVNYPEVAALKSDILEAAFASFDRRRQAGSLPHDIAADYDRFVAEGGEPLARFSIYEAIAERHGTTDRGKWRADLHSIEGEGVGRFAQANARAIRFSLYRQWVADRQLARAAARGRAAGLSVGLYRDLAVGAAPDGGETWTSPDAFVHGVSVGAPPDPFAADGQIWGVPPLDPLKLRDGNCAAFRQLVAANMRHAGALRIDHAMSLTRLFFVPDGAHALEGAYVRYPFEELLAALAEESHRAGCLVVGEDLGTVPWGFRERLAKAQILSMKILLFEREGTPFRKPTDYGHGSVASFGTHDLATFSGWLQGRDISLDETLGRSSKAEGARRRDERRADIAALSRLLQECGYPVDLTRLGDTPPPPPVLAALHGALGKASSAVVLVQADDLSGETDPLNLPGTDRENPNWRRRLRLTVEALEQAPSTKAVVQALADRVVPPRRS